MDTIEKQPIPTEFAVTLPVDDGIRSGIAATHGYLATAQRYQIDCPELEEEAIAHMNIGLRMIDELKRLKTGFVRPAKEIIGNAEAIFDAPIEEAQRGIALVKQSIALWRQKEFQRIALENKALEDERRRVRQQADADAAAARARAEQEAAEKRRKAAEAEETRRQAESEGNARAAAAAAAAAAKFTEQAEAAIENGNASAQRAQLEAAATISATAPAVLEKMAGAQMRANWVAELAPDTTWEQALARIAVESVSRPELLSLLSIDMPAANRLAKAQRQAMRVPGLVAVNQPIIAGSKR